MEETKLKSVVIQVPGEELETVNVELSVEEIRSIYLLRKEDKKEIVALEKKVKDMETSLKYSNDRRDAAESELKQANTLLTALGVPDKTKEEESWREEKLTVPTRIALYIANKLN